MNHKDVAKYLLENKADFQATNNFKWTALMHGLKFF